MQQLDLIWCRWMFDRTGQKHVGALGRGKRGKDIDVLGLQLGL